MNKNTHLSREQVIVLIQVSNEQGINLLPEFVFTGTDKRPPQINALARIKYQEVTKGLYWLEQPFSTIHQPGIIYNDY